jgi:hypothetical protein
MLARPSWWTASQQPVGIAAECWCGGEDCMNIVLLCQSVAWTNQQISKPVLQQCCQWLEALTVLNQPHGLPVIAW